MKFTEYFFCCACLFNKAAVKVAGLTLGCDVIVPFLEPRRKTWIQA